MNRRSLLRSIAAGFFIASAVGLDRVFSDVKLVVEKDSEVTIDGETITINGDTYSLTEFDTIGKLDDEFKRLGKPYGFIFRKDA